ncbi:MAG: porin [Bacteroidota bacterium]
MTRGRKAKAKASAAISGAILTAALFGGGKPAMAEIPLVEHDGWRLSTDGRVNTFISVAQGKGLPEGQQENLGAGTADIATSTGDLHSTRIRGGFIMSILGFTGYKEISPNFKVTTRVALWMNITGSRTKNNSGGVDPRELYGKIEGGWGSFLAGSHLSLFGRGGILVDADIAHGYGLGYPCAIKDAGGGACGMVGFGAPFPGFDPGFVYATPSFGGLQLSVGIYDPATNGNAQLNRAPLPRVEGELKFDFKDRVRVFASGFWQALEGTSVAGKNLAVTTWGVQAGGMLAFGPVMLGGAAFKGNGFSPLSYIEESVLTADSLGVLRGADGGFGLGAVRIDSLKLKIAGGAGVFNMHKNIDDSGAMTPTGAPANPALIKQNLGVTVGLYKQAGPVHLALEYFRAQHTWHDRGVGTAADPNVFDHAVTPQQVVNFINAGMTIAW